MLKLLTCFVLVAFWSIAPKAQVPDLTGVEIVVHPVAGNIYMLEATGDVAGNIAVSVGPDGILIVDDQFAELATQVHEALVNLDKGALRFIINTHHHQDHSGGNAELKRRHGSLIITHDNARKHLKHYSKDHWPVITFSEKLSIHFNGEEIVVLAAPGGHTDNDAVVLFTKSNVIHMGDLFNSGISSFPFVDIGAGGSALRIPGIIANILPYIPDDAKVIAGHGPLSDKKGLHRFMEMLDETIPFVKSRKAAGKSLEEIIAEGLPRKYDAWGYGYTSANAWIELIFKSPDE